MDNKENKNNLTEDNKGNKEFEEGRTSHQKESSFKSELISWLQVIVGAVILAFLLNTFVIANSKIPTGSMKDTIMEGDRVIGLRLSYTFGEPKRGDIAIFDFGWICNRCGVAMGEGEAPEICPYCGQEITHPKTLYYVKRVIGVAGDKIEIKRDGSVKASEIDSSLISGNENITADTELVTAAVYLNGEKLSESYLREPMLYTGDMEFEVPEDSYFMLGDNRNDSGDARYWNDPYISKDKMLAKVYFKYFPGIKWLAD